MFERNPHQYAFADFTVLVLAFSLIQFSSSLCYAQTLNNVESETASNQTPSIEQQHVFFEMHVRPLLAEKCVSCHGSKKQEGELRLDTRESLVAGGDSGSAIDLERHAESLLLAAVRFEGPEMPPTGQLSLDKIAVLEKWITWGAPWPNDGEHAQRITSDAEISDEDRAWWAFQKVKRPSLTTTDEKISPVDWYVQQEMKARDLTPAPEASRLEQLRRLKFVLHGLPPSIEEIDSFLHDQRSDAYEHLVDRLLQESAFGEQWARFWLDLVRYADSDGYRADHYRANMWHYRDYVIKSFNEDKAYDRFVQEQIAGDELFPDNLDAQTATGYLRHWIYEYNSRDAVTQRNLILQDLVDTTGDVFLGVGYQCARCHDHKYDPVLQRDYFRLQAFFEPILPREQTLATVESQQKYESELNAWEEQQAAIIDEIATIEAPFRKAARAYAIGRFPDDIQALYHRPEAEKSAFDKQISYLIDLQVLYEYTTIDNKIKGEEKDRLFALRKQLTESVQAKPAALPIASTVCDADAIAPPTVIPNSDGQSIEPGFLTVLDGSDASCEPISDRSTGRRTALAHWLTSRENPLVPRVIANRIWQQLMGQGLAVNPSDFGRLGGAPSHPDLLEYLASSLVDNDWSMKSLVREIVLSKTFRQSTYHPEYARCTTIDPQNQFYWRATARRLSAEQIRDSMLFVSEQLENKFGGEGVQSDVGRRSIYTRIMRNSRDPLLDVFDLPQFFSSESSRNTTTTPIQSLLMINSSEMLRHASALAGSLSDDKNPAARIDLLWRKLYTRPPTSEESESALTFLNNQVSLISKSQSIELRPENITGRMPYRDGHSVAIMESDKTPALAVQPDALMAASEFTIEGFFQLRSVFDTGSVRVLAGKWSGNNKKPGWTFGITGQGSRRKPQTLVLLIHGTKLDGSFAEAAVFSDQQIALNKPYFAAAAFKPASDTDGSVTFYLKDLSNDDEPMQSITVAHQIHSIVQDESPFTIGGLSGNAKHQFDGLIDDIKFTAKVLSEVELVLVEQPARAETVGFWRFEPDPGLLADSSPNNRSILPTAAVRNENTAEELAWIDLCHALLNTNEFLYFE